MVIGMKARGGTMMAAGSKTREGTIVATGMMVAAGSKTKDGRILADETMMRVGMMKEKDGMDESTR